VLIAEGATEAASLPVAARRLAEIDPARYASFEVLGICTIDAGSETQIADLGALYCRLGKRTFGVCDKQSDEGKAAIEAEVEQLFMHEEKGFEDLVLKNTKQGALEPFSDAVEWPPHLRTKYPDPKADLVAAIRDYFAWSKGDWGIADFLAQCAEAEMPEWIRNTCASPKQLCAPAPVQEGDAADDVEATNAEPVKVG
jgi:putative ATP-dependent endonuclease of the OLD family